MQRTLFMEQWQRLLSEGKNNSSNTEREAMISVYIEVRRQ